VIYFPSVILGALIGKAGAVVRGLETAFQVRIHIDSEGFLLFFQNKTENRKQKAESRKRKAEKVTMIIFLLLVDSRRSKGHYSVHKVEITGDRADMQKLKKRINFLESMELNEYFFGHEGLLLMTSYF
jgi:hypothetical protein